MDRAQRARRPARQRPPRLDGAYIDTAAARAAMVDLPIVEVAPTPRAFQWYGQILKSGPFERSIPETTISRMVLPSPNVVAGFLWLLLFQLVGEVTVRWLTLPLPGPVLGMLALFAVLVIRGVAPDHVRAAGSALLQYLMLLLVPATAA